MRTERRVVVTGAAGGIGSLLTRELRERWNLVATDRRERIGVESLDVTDIRACRELFAGADAVVHLAADPEPDDHWEELRGPNVEGAYAVAAAARECGIRRLVLASSLHAVSGYPAGRVRRTTDSPRPANVYGATKAWAEALGGWVASTSPTTVVALRLGFVAESAPPTHGGAQAPRLRNHTEAQATHSAGDDDAVNAAAWLSHRDCVRLMIAAVEAPLDPVSGGIVIVNGVSANRFPCAELGAAAEAIGYVPIDDAWRETAGGA